MTQPVCLDAASVPQGPQCVAVAAVLMQAAGGALVDAAVLATAVRAGGIGGVNAGAVIDVRDLGPPAPGRPLPVADIPGRLRAPPVARAGEAAQTLPAVRRATLIHGHAA